MLVNEVRQLTVLSWSYCRVCRLKLLALPFPVLFPANGECGFTTQPNSLCSQQRSSGAVSRDASNTRHQHQRPIMSPQSRPARNQGIPEGNVPVRSYRQQRRCVRTVRLVGFRVTAVFCTGVEGVEECKRCLHLHSHSRGSSVLEHGLPVSQQRPRNAAAGEWERGRNDTGGKCGCFLIP
jgi:hypothetical protein